ncbi:MAG TPA: Gfo/Idh/MocA family oxidoreductase, partial [Candidatus Dormibacteraeota bacterium]|nr:Gfo/Idh/MocA family oxidoreductase [Candidatus Dormibacteraeota bacterium]
MSGERKIRWGILGYARIAREDVIPAIQRSSNSQFYALASRSGAKLQECQARFPGSLAGYNYDELLNDPNVDAVYIPLPNSMHREWTIKAAKHGKHVLCEKPMGLTTAECTEMSEACRDNAATLMEAFMYRYSERTRTVLEVVRSGALGEIKFISSSFRFLLSNPTSIKHQPQLGGGSLYDVGCYAINFTGMLVDEIAGGKAGAGALPESLSVECTQSGGVDVLFSALLKYPSGLIASLNSGFNAQKRIHSEIIGDKGALEIPDTFMGNAGSLVLTAGTERKEIPVPESDRYRLEVED